MLRKLRYLLLVLVLLAATGVVVLGVAAWAVVGLVCEVFAAALSGIATTLIAMTIVFSILLYIIYLWQMVWMVALPYFVVRALEMGPTLWNAWTSWLGP